MVKKKETIYAGKHAAYASILKGDIRWIDIFDLLR